MKRIEHDALTGVVKEIVLTAEEQAQIELERTAALAAHSTKNSVMAKLAALGLTEAEVAALLGD